MSIIRFPPSANLVRPMASRLNWAQRLWRKLFGNRRQANVAKLKMDKARRHG